MVEPNSRPILLAMACNPPPVKNPYEDGYWPDSVFGDVVDIVSSPDHSPSDLHQEISDAFVDSFIDAIGKDVKDIFDTLFDILPKDTVGALDDDSADDGAIQETQADLGSDDGPEAIDSSGDVQQCQPVLTEEAYCDGLDDDCDGTTDEGCVTDLLGGQLVLFGVDLTSSELQEILGSPDPGVYLSAGILFNGNPNVGIPLCDFTTEAGIANIIIPCDDSLPAPIEGAGTLMYQGSPLLGTHEWFFFKEDEHIATVTFGSNGVGILFGPDVPVEASTCHYLFNQFSCQ